MKTYVSLEWAKKLKETGYPQDGWSECFYCVEGKGYIDSDAFSEILKKTKYWADLIPIVTEIARPCACEILEKLPHKIESDNGLYIPMIRKYLDSYNVEFINPNILYSDSKLINFEQKTLTDACAEMYCWLKQEGYLK